MPKEKGGKLPKTRKKILEREEKESRSAGGERSLGQKSKIRQTP